MCGIAGFVTAQPGARPGDVLERMMSALRHRGPDESGAHEDGLAWLGHRRLSIIDLATGQQPMSNEDGSLWIAYNGEVFNHADLRPELERAGHLYRTRCDTETILHAYEQCGADCVSRFRGMFAFAVWDRPRRTLFCARDRLGKKPLYYWWNGRLFAFASEIKGLFEHPEISPAFEDELLPEYLAFGYTSGDRTLFTGVRTLMPGHTLTLDLSAPAPLLQIRRYWDVPAPAPRPERRDDESWIRECRDRLEETVRLRLMSDVPLGMFLSGGVDSSAIAAVMKRAVPNPVETFSVGYRETAFSELGYARRVAEAIGTNHREVVVGRDDFFSALPRLIWHEDEPITWPSSVSLYFVAQLASRHVKVVLTGEGSDELFGGYARYRFYLMNQRWSAAYRLLPASARRWLRDRIATTRLLNGGLRRKAQHTLLGRGDDFESLYLDNFYSAFAASEQSRLFALPDASPYTGYNRYWNEAAGRSTLERLLYADQKTYLVELLMKQDQMSMAASIESRVPFLDHEFVEFAARVPERLKIRNGEQKYILKRAVEDLLPREIVYRRKMGFPTPLRQWLREPAAADLLSLLRDRGGLLAPYVNGSAVDELLSRHVSGLEDATDRIWRLLNLQLWGDLFITGRRGAHDTAHYAA